jgi:hypothetical protein
MFPFTPHTTLRPDYCSGGSLFKGGAAAIALEDDTDRKLSLSVYASGRKST